MNTFFNLKIEKLFKKLKDDVMDRFTNMLNVLQDYRQIGRIKIQVLEQAHQLNFILSDPEGKLSKQIVELENKLRAIVRQHFDYAFEAPEIYKNGIKGVEVINECVWNFEKEFKMDEVQLKIKQLVAEGKSELNAVHLDDAKDADLLSHISIFTKELSLESWLNTERYIKIFLQTKGKAPQGTFIQLFELCKDLKERDIGIGIAIPSISTNFSLMVKIAGLPETYCGEDITFVLKVFGAAIGKGFPIQSRVYAISASLFSIDFPFSS